MRSKLNAASGAGRPACGPLCPVWILPPRGIPAPLAIFILLLAWTVPAWAADQIEMSTYVPATLNGDMDRLHAKRATVGAPYSLTGPNPSDAVLTDGTLLVSQRIGIRTSDPRFPLHVLGDADGGGILLQYAGLGWSFPSSSSRRNESEFSLYRGGTVADGILTLRRYASAHTVLKIQAPPPALGPDPNPTYEASLSLVRGEEPDVEVMDIYNNGYPTETQFGIRLQKRGSGILRPFYVGFSDGSTKSDALCILPSGNIGIGTANPTGSTTAGTQVLAIADGTAPVGGRSGQTLLYSDTRSGITDLYVMDSAGNETPLGPHDPVTGEWIFFSKNTRTGRVVRIRMEELVREFERLSGKKFLEEWTEDPTSSGR